MTLMFFDFRYFLMVAEKDCIYFQLRKRYI